MSKRKEHFSAEPLFTKKILYYTTEKGNRIEYWLSEDEKWLKGLHITSYGTNDAERMMPRLEVSFHVIGGRSPIRSEKPKDDSKDRFKIFRIKDDISEIFEVIHSEYTIKGKDGSTKMVPEREIGFYRVVKWKSCKGMAMKD